MYFTLLQIGEKIYDPNSDPDNLHISLLFSSTPLRILWKFIHSWLTDFARIQTDRPTDKSTIPACNLLGGANKHNVRIADLLIRLNVIQWPSWMSAQQSTVSHNSTRQYRGHHADGHRRQTSGRCLSRTSLGYRTTIGIISGFSTLMPVSSLHTI